MVGDRRLDRCRGGRGRWNGGYWRWRLLFAAVIAVVVDVVVVVIIVEVGNAGV